MACKKPAKGRGHFFLPFLISVSEALSVSCIREQTFDTEKL